MNNEADKEPLIGEKKTRSKGAVFGVVAALCVVALVLGAMSRDWHSVLPVANAVAVAKVEPAVATCYKLKYATKWPHCSNLGACFSGQSLASIKARCTAAGPQCVGFSFTANAQTGGGCLKVAVGNCVNLGPFGTGSHGFYEKTSQCAPPAPAVPSYTYVGCKKDCINGRILNQAQKMGWGQVTTQNCADFCYKHANGPFKYFGTQYSQECFCGNTLRWQTSAGNCNMKCAGNNAQICGGSCAESVYKFATAPAPAPACPPTTPLTNEITALKATIKQKDATITAKSNTINNQATTIGNMNVKINGLLGTVAARDATIKQKDATITAKSGIINQQATTIGKMNVKINGLLGKVAAKNVKIGQLNRKIGGLNGQIARLKRGIRWDKKRDSSDSP